MSHPRSATAGRRLPAALCVAACALLGGTTAAHAWPQLIEFEEAEIRIEINATDGDAGLQLFVDGEGWRKVTVIGPDWRPLIKVQAKSSLRRQGVTEFFLESDEPSFDEFPLEAFLDRFRPGEYLFLGVGLEGDLIVGVATLTHVIPEGVMGTAPEEGEVVDPDEDLIVRFEVADQPGVNIVWRQLIVETEDPLMVYSVDLRPEQRAMKVPAGFLQPCREYKYEIIEREESGNQTATEVEFETGGEDCEDEEDDEEE